MDQLFSVKKGRLQYLSKPVSDGQIAEARRVLDEHVIPKSDEKHFYLSLWFCIASQASGFERPMEFIRRLRNESLSTIKDHRAVQEIAETVPTVYTDRFKPAAEYIDSVGIIPLVAAYRANPKEVRRQIVKDVYWVNMKTASFWYLCLGGTELMTMDRHNYGQIAGLDVKLNPRFYTPTRRLIDNRPVSQYPCERQYERIENDVLEKLVGEPHVKNGKGTDAALVTTLFWIEGVMMARGHDPRQELFVPRVTPFAGLWK